MILSLVLFIILNPNGSQFSMNLSTFHWEKVHHDWRDTMPSIRVTCPHRQERKRERDSLGIVWVMTNRFRGPAHPSRPLSSPLDTNRSCRGHVRARVEDIVSIDRSPKRFVPLFFDGAFITLATALNRPVSVRSRETKAVCHYRCSLLVELSETS